MRRDGEYGFLVGELFFHAFAPLLRFDGQGGGGAGEQAFEADGFAGVAAVAVFALVDEADGVLDFVQQFAFAVAGAQFQRVFFFLRGAVGGVGGGFVFFQLGGGVGCVGNQFFLLFEQQLAEEFKLVFVHVFVFRAVPVDDVLFGQFGHGCLSIGL